MLIFLAFAMGVLTGWAYARNYCRMNTHKSIGDRAYKQGVKDGRKLEALVSEVAPPFARK